MFFSKPFSSPVTNGIATLSFPLTMKLQWCLRFVNAAHEQ